MIATSNSSKGVSVKNKYTKVKHHTFLAGSRKVEAGDYTFYVHDEECRIIAYKGVKDLYLNEGFDSPKHMETHLQEHLKKIEALKEKAKPAPNHDLTVGTVLVSNTNINDKSNNMVEFYQVTEVIDIANIKVRLLEQDVYEEGNFKICIPRVGDMVGEPIQKMVLANSIDIGVNRIAIKLPYKEVELIPGLKLKIYEKQQFGLKL